MSSLLFITDKYPYGSGEAFISDELKRTETFSRIFIAPVGVYEKRDLRELPCKESELIDIGIERLNIAERLFLLVRSVVSIEVWREIMLLLRTTRFNLHNLVFLFNTYSYSLKRYRQLCKWIAQHDINMNDTVIQSYWLHVPADVAVRLARKFKCKVASRCHRCDVYEDENQNHYIPFRSYLLTNLDAVYCISNDAIDYLSKTYPAYRDKYKLSRLGTVDYGCSDWSPSDTVRLVSCSYINPVKRVDLIVKALEYIDDINIEWTHYGSGKDEVAVKTLAENLLGNKNNIHYSFKGSVAHNALMEIYKHTQYDYFINVSESEGVPVSIMEALSFGIPVIATNVGGTSEIVHNNINGILIQNNITPEQLNMVIKELYYRSASASADMRAEARRLWEKESSSNEVYASHTTQLKELLYE